MGTVCEPTADCSRAPRIKPIDTPNSPAYTRCSLRFAPVGHAASRPACARGCSVPLRSTPRRIARAVPRRQGRPALGRRRCRSSAYGLRCPLRLPLPRPCVARIAVARSRRRFGCARKANPRTLAPAEHKAHATIKSQSDKRQAQPAAPESSHTHQGQALARRCPRLLGVRVRSLYSGGWAESQNQQQPQPQESTRRAPAAWSPTYPQPSVTSVLSENATHVSALTTELC